MVDDQVNVSPEDKPKPASSSALPEEKKNEIVAVPQVVPPDANVDSLAVSGVGSPSFQSPIDEAVLPVTEIIQPAEPESPKISIIKQLVAKQVEEVAAVSQDKKRIVVIDDHAQTSELMRRILEKNYDVKSFIDSTIALQDCISETPDLVIVDLRMPGMNGKEFIARLKSSLESQGKDLPRVIITTAGKNLVEEDLRDIAKDVNVSLITKPFSLPDFSRKVNREISKAAGLTETVLDLLDSTHFLTVSGLDVVGTTFRDDYQKLEFACNHLMTDVVLYLERIDKLQDARSDSTFLQTRASQSFEYLKTILLGLPPEKLRDFDIFKYVPRKGGSSISEKGVRLFVKKSNAGYWFIRNIYDRKRVPHAIIDQIRAEVSRYFRKYDGRFNVPYRLPSPQRELSCSWSIEEAIMGPDLGYVFEKIKSELGPSPRNNQRNTQLNNIRNGLIDKCLDDLKVWQEKAPQVNHSSVSREPDSIEKYFRHNVSRVIHLESHRNGIEFSKEERDLWDLCIELFNARNLELDGKTIVRSLDATPMNVVLKFKEQDEKVEKLNPSIDEIINALTDKDGTLSKKELNSRLYHVDHGFVYSHYLEDFFHLVDSFEAKDLTLSPSEQIRNNILKFNGFVRRSAIIRRGSKDYNPNKGAFYLMGFYRNIRKLFLTIAEYHENNLSAFHEAETISRWRFRVDKRRYEDTIKHHAELAQAYMERAIERYRKNNSIILRERSKFISASYYNICTELESLVNDSSSGLAEIGNRINTIKESLGSVGKQFYLRKYLTNSMYMGMSAILSRVTSRFQNVRLPSETLKVE